MGLLTMTVEEISEQLRLLAEEWPDGMCLLTIKGGRLRLVIKSGENYELSETFEIPAIEAKYLEYLAGMGK